MGIRTQSPGERLAGPLAGEKEQPMEVGASKCGRNPGQSLGHGLPRTDGELETAEGKRRRGSRQEAPRTGGSGSGGSHEVRR